MSLAHARSGVPYIPEQLLGEGYPYLMAVR